MIPNQLQWLHETNNLHPYCYKCIANRVAKRHGPKGPDGKHIYSKNDFLVSCQGIPADYTKLLPSNVWREMSTKEREDFLCSQDPVFWAKKYLNWVSRESPQRLDYQALVLRCSSTRIYLRWGRRLGKTAVLRIKCLWFALFHSRAGIQGEEAALGKSKRGGDVMILSPYKNQLKAQFFDEIKELLDRHPLLKNSVTRSVANPYTIELSNGSEIVGFAGGVKGGVQGATVRGYSADFILVDESDYMDPKTLEAALGILIEDPRIQLCCSSTPTGNREGHFYKACNSPYNQELHFPSWWSPTWTKEQEDKAKADYDRITYLHEIEAEWGEMRAGVFPSAFVSKAKEGNEYLYGHSKEEGQIGRDPQWTYVMGVDWNQVHGNQIVVLGGNPKDNKIYVVDRVEIDTFNYQQTISVKKIVELNRIWRFAAIYVDQGHGDNQVESLHLLGKGAKHDKQNKFHLIDARLATIVKPINFSSTVELIDPATNEVVRKRAKQALVQNTMRKFEDHAIIFPEHDNQLEAQLLGYIIERITSQGQPVYKAREEKVGDHIIDALFVGLWAFTKEFSAFSRPTFFPTVSISKFFGRLSSIKEFRDEEPTGDINAYLMNEWAASPTEIGAKKLNLEKESSFQRGKNVGVAISGRSEIKETRREHSSNKVPAVLSRNSEREGRGALWKGKFDETFTGHKELRKNKKKRSVALP